MILAVAVSVWATQAQAQAVPAGPTLEIGSRVRITAPGRGLTAATGVVQGLDGETLVVRFDHPRAVGTIGRGDIERLEVSMGSERKALRGMGRGFLVGAGAGLFLGLASGSDTSGFIQFSAGEKAVMGGAVFGVLGAVLGLGVGLATKHQTWADLASPDLVVRLGPRFMQGGPGILVGFTLNTR